jgi:CheY-like chemotaxis protein
MATMGTIAAGVAHEINNPLTAVMANLDFVAADLAALAQKIGSTVDLSAMHRGIEEARVAAARVQNIARDLKVFSRAEDDVQEAVDLHRVLDSSLRMSWNEVRHRAQLQKDYGKVPPVLANESRLGQVFLNLIINAAQAIEEGHADVNLIQVRTRYDAATDRVITDITDTGSGISPDDLPKLFTPFFTTKPSGVGTGLGLAMCQRIVTGLGGEITVNSVLGTGATFSVALPSTQLKETIVAPVEAVVPTERRGRILVVDDEPMVGNVVQRTLAPEHDLTALTSAADALALISKGERFDLILCDLMMPVMTGVEFHAALDKIAPDQAARMVFLTGGAFTPLARAFLDAVPNPRLDKPFALQALRNLVNEQLAKW